MQSDRDKLIHAQFKKGNQVRIKKGEFEGQFGVITRVTDDEGKRFLQVKLEKLKKTVEKTTDEVKVIPEAELEQEFKTIRDIDGRDDFTLVDVDTDVEATKDMLADKDKNDFDGFFVKIEDGEITQAYGFSGNIPNLDKSLTRVETTSESLKRRIV